jgi:phage terminase large subunit-like protein
MGRLDDLTRSLVEVYANQLSKQEQEELMDCLQILADEQKYNKLANYLPDEGEFKRSLYPKHVDFFNAGSEYRERFFVSGNRVGKSEAGTAESVYHLTGDYPDWWQGKRYNAPILAWVGGDTATTCRDIIQKKFLGEINDMGSGMIPKDKILDYKTRRNVPDAVEIIRVKHITGGVSTVVIKTYEQGRATWQGTEVDWIFLDEEPPEEVYGEALIRLMTTNGSIIVTFTPLQGVTPLVLNALENSQETDAKFPKYVQVVTWADVPHITEDMKEQMLAATPPQLRDARSKGIPTVGDGLVYPIDQKLVTIDDFILPKHFQKMYGFDVGWNNTAIRFIDEA